MQHTLQLGPIGQITTTVTDVARAVAFYRDVLGIPQMPIPAPPSMAFFDCGGVRLMLSLPEGEVQHAASVLYFKTGDIQAAYATLQERGADLIDQPHLIAKLPDHELWMCFLRDPDGNPLALMEERR
jgi:methylmalonyl-CoA/ethylmalonyl-CoA epimerase